MERYLRMMSCRPRGTVIMKVMQEGNSFLNATFISRVCESPRIRIREDMVKQFVYMRLARKLIG
jgi:hypothetical protein